MSFKHPILPYAMDALAPLLSEETLEYHYGKHHRTYFDNLNKLVIGTAFENATLEKIIAESNGPILNNGSQAWNHTFYFDCLSPLGGGEPTGFLAQRIDDCFGSLEKFKAEFTQKAIGTFGSGWAWLVKTSEGELATLSTSNAGNPIRDGHVPLMTCDVWEHAYYIDYRNARPAYLEAFWKLVNWEYVAANLKG